MAIRQAEPFIPKKPKLIKVPKYIEYLSLGIGVAIYGVSALITQLSKIPEGTLYENGNFKAKQTDYLTPKAQNEKLRTEPIPVNTHTLKFNSSEIINPFFKKINELEKITGLKINLTYVTNPNLEDVTYFNNQKLEFITKVALKVQETNALFGDERVPLVQNLTIDFSEKYGSRTDGASAFPHRKEIQFYIDNFEDYYFIHEIMHLIADRLGIELIGGNQLSEESIFKIMYFYPEFGYVIEKFYNKGIVENDPAFSFYESGENVEIVGYITQYFPEIFKPTSERNEQEVQRALRLIALIEYSFGKRGITNLENLRKLVNVESDNPISQEDLDSIQRYKESIDGLRADIRSKIPNGISAAKLPEGFESRLMTIRKREKLTFENTASVFVFIGLIALIAGKTWLYKTCIDFYHKIVDKNRLEIDPEIRKALTKKINAYLGGRITYEEFEIYLKGLESY